MDYKRSALETAIELNTDAEKGLSPTESHNRLVRNGRNEIEPPAHKSIAQLLAKELTSAMTWAPLLSAVLLAVLGRGPFVWSAVALVALAVLNALLNLVQVRRAQDSTLLELIASHMTKVRRGDTTQLVEGALLAVGDLILLDVGDVVPADAKLVKCDGLQVDESSLTGEHVPADKQVAEVAVENGTERATMIFFGTKVLRGSCEAIITATGTQTEMGKAAQLLLESRTDKMPLALKTRKIGALFGVAGLLLTVLMILAGIVSHAPIPQIFLNAAMLLAVAVPIAFPLVSALVLLLAKQRLAYNGVTATSLATVEALGGITAICADKAGVLTSGKFKVAQITPLQVSNEVLLGCAVLCTADETKQDTMARALMEAAKGLHVRRSQLLHKEPKTAELRFSDSRKIMTTVHRTEGGYHVIVKGSFDWVLPRCTALDAQGTPAVSAEQLAEIHRENDDMAMRGWQVLAVAHRYVKDVPEDLSELETDLIPLGLIGLSDPLDEETKASMKFFKKTGVRSIIVTSDQVATALSIARELGLAQSEDEVLRGVDIDAMSDRALAKSVGKCSVFACITKEQKVRIITALQSRGESVAVTGKSLLDVPALRCADVGFALQQSGEVVRDSADVLLCDNSYATVVNTVRVGRNVYVNLQKIGSYLMRCCAAGLFLMIFSGILSGGVPLYPTELLWLNVVAVLLPALALSLEPDSGLPVVRSRKSRERFFMDGLLAETLLGGMLLGLSTLLAQMLWGAGSAYLTLGVGMVLTAFHCRSARSILQAKPWRNLYLLVAMAAALVLVFLAPQLPLFVHLQTAQKALPVLLAVVVFALMEAWKMVREFLGKQEGRHAGQN